MVNVNRVCYKLEYVNARFVDKEFLMKANSLCPNIKELFLEKQVNEMYVNIQGRDKQGLLYGLRLTPQSQ